MRFGGILAGAEDQADWRVFAFAHPMRLGVIQVKMHLPCIRVTEAAGLEVD